MAERQTDSPLIFFIDNLDDKIEYIFSKLRDHNKWWKARYSRRKNHHIVRPQLMEANKNSTRVNKNKPHIPHQGWNYATSQSSWGLTGVVCSSAEEDQRANLASPSRASSKGGQQWPWQQ